MELLANVHPARQGSPAESVSVYMCVYVGGWATLRPFVVGHRLSPGLNYQAPVVDDCIYNMAFYLLGFYKIKT